MNSVGRATVALTLVFALLSVTTGAAAQEADGGSEAPSMLPIVVTGVGAAGLILGGIFAAAASGAYDSAASDPVHESAAGSLDSANTFTTLANTMFVLGGSLMLIGVSWLAVEFTRPSRTGMTARLEVGPGSLSLAGSFD